MFAVGEAVGAAILVSKTIGFQGGNFLVFKMSKH